MEPNYQNYFKQMRSYRAVFLGTLALIVGFTVLALSLLLQAKKDRKWAERRRKMEIELNVIRAQTHLLRASTLSILFQNYSWPDSEYQRVKGNLKSHLSSANILTDDVWSQQEEIKEIDQLLSKIYLFTDEALTINISNQARKRYLANQLNNLGNQIERRLNRMSQYERRLYKTQHARIETTETRSLFLLAFYGLVTTFISGLGYRRLVRDNQERALAIEELKRSNRDLEQFAYVASHDLQEPLRKILTFSERFVQSTDADLKNPYLIRMQEAARRMQTLISDLLSYSQLNKAQEFVKSLSVNPLIHKILDDLQILKDEAKAEITVDDLPTLSRVDERQIRQLFYNLINNALKFRKNNETCRVHISGLVISKSKLPAAYNAPAGVNSFASITVSDNGIGFEEIYLNKIFTIFQRLNGRSEYPGNGIGLALCQKICHNHSAFIKAQSTLNQGATFTVYFPIYE